MPDGILITRGAVHGALLRLHQTVAVEADSNAEDGCTAALAGLHTLAALFAPEDQAPAETPPDQVPETARSATDAAPPPAEAPAPEPACIDPAPPESPAMPPAEPAAPRTPAEAPPAERKWTEARRALLQELWPALDVPPAELLRRINALLGPAVSTTSGLYSEAKRIGLPGSRYQAADSAAAPPPAEPAPALDPAEPPPPPADPVAPCSSGDQAKPEKWSQARKALLRELFPNHALSMQDLADRVNALPGEPVTASQVSGYGYYLGLKRPPASHPTRGITLHKGSELPAVPDDKAEAVKLLEAGMSGRAVAEEMGLPLDLVSGWAAEVRERQKQARGARP